MNTTEQLRTNINTALRNKFPNARIVIGQPTKGIGGSDLFCVTFGIVGDKRELTSGIEMNDPVDHKFMIWVDGDKFQAEALRSGISINPVEKFFAMSTVKTKFRKVTGDVAVVTKAFNRFADRLTLLVEEHESNIYQRGNYSDKYFVLP